MYSKILRPILFALPPETAHNLTLSTGVIARNSSLVRSVIRSIYSIEDPALAISLFGLKFRNPFGVAAGLDKDCTALELLDAIGFGHVEIGTVTPRPQPGNPRPRLFRCPSQNALINRLGFPSEGADVVRDRLILARQKGIRTLVGVNLGKQKDTSLDDAHRDYLAVFEKLQDLGDYFALNISSPNTPELRKLQEPERLAKLLTQISQKNTYGKPVLFKISPDLSESELNSIVSIALELKVPGIIATNTTLSRDGISEHADEAGGLSGPPLFERSLNVISKIYNQTQGALPIIGVGGVNSGQRAGRMISAGASLVQTYTGLVYEGPALLREMAREIIKVPSGTARNPLSELVGSMHKDTGESTTL